MSRCSLRWGCGRSQDSAHHVRIPFLVQDADVVELDVEEPERGGAGQPNTSQHARYERQREVHALIDRLELPTDRHVVLELDGKLLVLQRLEDREDELCRTSGRNG